MSSLLQCRSVSKRFQDGKSTVNVLNKVSFSIHHGEQVAILGSSGSGKSTLLHILGALDRPSEGDVLIDGEALFSLADAKQAAFRNKHLGFVYQFHHLLPEFSAVENVAMPLLIAGLKPTTALQQAATMLDRVNLSHRQHHKPSELSGGERQRVAIARAVINEPKLVLADEPTGNLDKSTGESIATLLSELRDSLNTAFIVVTHDTQMAQQFDRIMTLSDGFLKEAP
ncbi:lipoprotein-releasing ABC transporter ATP-binding protein LolD [Alteromonas oceanisediminis]|uniref:lipoprotein-releasing ABC transporter ATP-binding protein LolD n=1 Tax=Alteromonas oceanisediminis TaxID=2836180 RepID=UPI001BD9C741|nr:lipoprotein-releasing ABC transporter ATP-binding protein LolD [Alteromonas oceanisediminis]MBT0587220.1 lipoprotein-releasing ABC transporter ATP-binding protein LolD [Alteromonas oceanisediminis]